MNPLVWIVALVLVAAGFLAYERLIKQRKNRIKKDPEECPKETTPVEKDSVKPEPRNTKSKQVDVVEKKELFKGIKFRATPSVEKDVEMLVRAGGGEMVKESDGERPVDFIISCEKDRKSCETYLLEGMKIHSIQLLSTAIKLGSLEPKKEDEVLLEPIFCFVCGEGCSENSLLGTYTHVGSRYETSRGIVHLSTCLRGMQQSFQDKDDSEEFKVVHESCGRERRHVQHFFPLWISKGSDERRLKQYAEAVASYWHSVPMPRPTRSMLEDCVLDITLTLFRYADHREADIGKFKSTERKNNLRLLLSKLDMAIYLQGNFQTRLDKVYSENLEACLPRENPKVAPRGNLEHVLVYTLLLKPYTSWEADKKAFLSAADTHAEKLSGGAMDFPSRPELLKSIVIYIGIVKRLHKHFRHRSGVSVEDDRFCEELLDWLDDMQKKRGKLRYMYSQVDAPAARIFFGQVSKSFDDQKLNSIDFVKEFEISHATHFVTDSYDQKSSNTSLIEALDAGKFIVKPSWIDKCLEEQQRVDERAFFPDDCTTAKQVVESKVLFKGMKFRGTRSVERDVEILVKAAGGELVKSDDESSSIVPVNFIISCEDERKSCVKYVLKGMKIHSLQVLFTAIELNRLEPKEDDEMHFEPVFCFVCGEGSKEKLLGTYAHVQSPNETSRGLVHLSTCPRDMQQSFEDKDDSVEFTVVHESCGRKQGQQHFLPLLDIKPER